MCLAGLRLDLIEVDVGYIEPIGVDNVLDPQEGPEDVGGQPTVTDIEGDDLKFILESISEENIEHFVKEQELFKLRASKRKDENTRLKEDLISKENEVEKHKQEFIDIQRKLMSLEEKDQKPNRFVA